MTVSPSVSLRRADAFDTVLERGGAPNKYWFMSD